MQNKKAWELGVIVIAMGVLALMVIPLFHRKEIPNRLVPGTASSGAVVKGSVAASKLLTETIKEHPIEDDTFYERLSQVAGALPVERDPFSFAYAGPVSLRDGLDLTGITWDAQKPAAIINGNFFNVGDEMGQFKVVKIQEDRVVLEDNAGEFELRLKRS